MTQFDRYRPAGWLDDDGCLIQVKEEQGPNRNTEGSAGWKTTAGVTLSFAMALGAVGFCGGPWTPNLATGAHVQSEKVFLAPIAFRQHLVRLAEQWSADCAFLSSATQRTAHPSFRQLVKMGKAAIPFLVELLDTPGDWYLALMEITGEDPAGKDAWGQHDRMVAAWKKWAEYGNAS